MLRRLGIRGKVLAALAVPVVVLFGGASVISAQAMESSNVARAVNELVSTADELASLTNAMQVERQEMLAFLADPAASRDALYAARTETDTRSAEYSVAIAPVDVSVLDPGVGEYLRASQKVRDNLPTTPARFDVTGTSLPAVVDAEYTAMIKLHVETARVIADVLPDRSLAKYLDAYGLVREAREKVVRELPAAVQVISTGGADARAVVNLAPSVAVTTAIRAQARTAVNQLRLTNIQLTTQDAAYAGQRLLLSSGNAGAVATMDLASFEEYSAAEVEELSTVAEQVRVKSVEQAARNQAATIRQARITIAATLLIVFVSIAIAFLIAGQIVVPLRRLTKAVGDVREALPLLVEQVAAPGEAPQLSLVQIPVTSRDEVGRLARAFNDVNATTIQIAQEQAALRGSIAEMFVNVARRDQVLLNRQISFIDALEQTEEDPNVLGNLFRLDHLATRMRRNAESLLVLAGIESGRRMRDAMPLSDVIRTASSEIEQYDRVQLELGIDPPMVGFSALAAAHLVAELLENATVFSEPGTPVEVATSIDGDYVQVVVRDHGLGMSDAEIEAAQLKIRSTAAGDVLGAQRLGFYVVGRLASRLKAHVVISNVKNGKGTLVAVRFPVRLFELSHVPAADLSAPSALVEPEPPVVEAVDLAALTDGETSLGLPRRRARADVEAPAMGLPDGPLPDGVRPADATPADGLPAAAGGLEVPGLEVEVTAPAEETVPERDGRMFVLAPLEQARLTPELAVRTEGWAPEVPAAASGSRLPNRANAQRKAGVDPTVAKPVTPRVSKADRGALFGGFRGRAADVPAPADRPPLDPRTIPGAHDVSQADVAFVLPELAIDDDDDFVIPQLEPDEVPWAPEMQLAESELVARADVPEVVPTTTAPPVSAAPVNAAPANAAPVSAAPTVELPTVAPLVAAQPPAAQPFASPPVTLPSAFVSTLNEARAWGAEDLSASSWRPAPVVGEEQVALVEPAPVADRAVVETPVDPLPVAALPVAPLPAVDLPVVDLPIEPPLARVADLPVVPDEQIAETLAAASEPKPVPAAGPPARPAKRGWFSRRSTARTTVVAEIVADSAGPVPADAVNQQSPVAEQPLVAELTPVEPFVPEPFVPDVVSVPDTASSAAVVRSDVVVPDGLADVRPAEPEHVAILPSRGKIGRHGRRGAAVPDFSVSAIATPAVQPDALVPEPVAQDIVVPEAVAVEAVVFEAIVPEAVVPEAVVPEAVVLDTVAPEPAAPEPISPEPQHELTTTPPAVAPTQAPTRSLRGFFGQRPVATDPTVVELELELEPKAAVVPEVTAVVEPEPTVVVPAPDPMPITVPWAPTSVAEIIDSALDLPPIPDAAVPAPAKRASRGWWGRKSGELLENAPWFASATELPAADSVEATPVSEPVPWISTSGDATALVAVDEAEQPATAVVPQDDVAPADVAPVAVVLPALVPPLALPPLALPIPEVADAAKPARRGPRNWLGHKSPASPNVAGPALPTRLPTPPPTGEALRPDQSGNDGRWTPAGPAPRWTPQRDLPEFEAYMPSTAAPSVPSGGWAVPSGADHGAPDGAANLEADNRGVPTPALPPVIPPTSPRGRLDDDVAAMLALRSDIQEQAFAELGQLAAYRPSVVGASSSNSLTRRVPTAVPAQAVQSEGARATTRDAAQLRSRLSSFQSGTSRGRIAAEQTVDKVPGDTDEPTGAGTVITRSRAADVSGTSHEEEE